MKNKLKILYLYSELVGYQIPIFKEFVTKYNADVHVMSWDKNKIKPYIPELISGVTYYKRSDYSKEKILSLAFHIKPDIVYISGWMDKAYMYVTKRLKKKKIPIVTAFDDIWTGSARQKLGALLFPFYFKKYFTYAWVAGAYQFEFAKKMGFKNNEIIFDMLSADTSLFSIKKNQKSSLQKSFLYVGNFRKVKGVDILIEAFKIYKKEFYGQWNLICIGNGELESLLMNVPGIKLYPFLTSPEIIDISSKSDVLILPSRHDQWGVVVHEFTCLGMPLLLSENVGAKSALFINGFNGFEFKNNSAKELAKQMCRFEKLSFKDLELMGHNSHQLSKKISVSTSAANFISIINRSNG